MMDAAAPRRLGAGRLVIASHNAGKVREIGDLVAPFGLDVVSAGALGLAEPEENGATFRDNALIKAEAAATTAGLPALADDSGLVVPALDGAPGVFSARWAGPGKDFALAMRRVEAALAGKSDRRASFVCALVLAWPDGHQEVFEGVVHGHLVRRRAAATGSATIRFSLPTATAAPSVRSSRRRSTASATAPTRSAKWLPPASLPRCPNRCSSPPPAVGWSLGRHASSRVRSAAE